MRRFINRPKEVKFTPFQGGLDIVTPQMIANPGTLRAGQNIYQDVNSGYITGMRYERFDGQPKPSAARYSILQVELTDTVAVGNTITDGAETAVVIAMVPGYLILTKDSGSFSTGNISVAGVVGTCVGPQQYDSGATAQLNAQYKNLAADEYRKDIAAVPGIGKGRGYFHLGDVRYAWRDNAGGTACELYKSTTSGWTKVELGRSLAFTSGGTYVIVDGNTITGATSGATAIVTKVIVESGTFAGGDAAGRFIFATQTGTFQSENLDVGANANVATIAGNSAAQTMLPGGTFEHIAYNFTGLTGGKRIYGCDGVNKAFEFNGTFFAPINTGLSTDTPRHIAVFQQCLMLSVGPAIIGSVLSNPFQYSSILGGAVFSVGDDVVNFSLKQGQQDTGTLSIYTRGTINILYNNGSATKSNWTIVSYKDDIGAIEWTAQTIGNTFFFDDKGITELTAAQEFGNFLDSVQSNNINPWLATRKNLITDSCIIRTKNLYCLFFNDLSALFCTVVNGQIVASCPQMFAHRVERAFSSEDSSGNEVVGFIDNNGFVYEMNKGTSHDGQDIEWWIDLAYDSQGAPYTIKDYYRAIFEITGEGFAEFYTSYVLGYNAVRYVQPGETLAETPFSSGNWDLGNWDFGTWDGRTLMPVDIGLRGAAENISLRLRSSSDYYDPIRIAGALTQFIYGRAVR